MTAPAPATTTVEVTVPWVEFRQSLCAVLPHVAKDKDSSILNRLRIEVRTTGEILVGATNRFTAGLAMVHAHIAPDEGRRLDLHADEVRKILAVFPEIKDEAGDYTLHLAAADEQLEIRDVSGMVDGERLTVNLLTETEDFPELPRAFARWTHREPVEITRTAFALEHLSLFKAALKCFGDSYLDLSMLGLHTVLIVVGEHFLGYSTGSDRAEEIDRDRSHWAGVLDADLPAPHLGYGVVDITEWTTEADPADPEGDHP